MRIAVGGILHESNTFARGMTALADFGPRDLEGPALLDYWRGSHHEIAGFLDVLDGLPDDVEILPTLAVSATPGPVVAAEALDWLAGTLCDRLRAGPRPDGMLLALHGAMVSEAFPDADGEILRRVRETLGPAVPLITTLDFHANVSDQMAACCDALIVYQTNPHLDQRPRGRDAARLLLRSLRGEVRPVQAVARPPMLWNILHQNTAAEPFRSLLLEAHESAEPERRGGILDVSLCAGYLYADVEEVGPSAVVVTDGNRELARLQAERWAAAMWDVRERLRIDLPDADEAVRRALSARPPVVLVEMGDNIGGGSPGDGTWILGALLRARAAVPDLGGAVAIWDPETAAQAAALGVGREETFTAGGKTDPAHGPPEAFRAVVRSLHDGRFYEPRPRHGGVTRWNQGLTAVLEVVPTHYEPERQLLVAVNSRRTAPMSLHQLTSLGIPAAECRILNVKAAIAYRAAYEPIAGAIIEVDTPGTTAVNPARFEYRRARRPLWPLEGRPDAL